VYIDIVDKYTTIAISKETQRLLLELKQELEKAKVKSFSYDKTINFLCKMAKADYHRFAEVLLNDE
jgi:hypothetical protein